MKTPRTWKRKLDLTDDEILDLLIANHYEEHHSAYCNYYHPRHAREIEAYDYRGYHGNGVVLVLPDSVHHAAVVVYYL